MNPINIIAFVIYLPHLVVRTYPVESAGVACLVGMLASYIRLVFSTFGA